MMDTSTDLLEHRHTVKGGGSRQKRRRRAWFRITLWTASGLMALLLMAGCVLALWLKAAAKSALPVLDGDLQVAGLSAPVTVRRDAHGVPHIEAATQEDLWIAQGYVTAQDRLWQMDAFRRNANGELAEIMGPSMVWHDKTQRVLQFRNTARRVYASLSPADRARLDAYARGVNVYIDQHQDSLPPEFKLLFYRPQPWSGVDSLSIGMMMVEMLDTHFYVKLSREKIAARLNNDKLEHDLYPTGSWRDRPPTGELIDLSQPHVAAPPPTNKNDDDDDDDERTQALGTLPGGNDLRAALGLPACRDCQPGSNNWVISGKHTASGKPLLANDMHLGLMEPNIWYMADLEAPGFHAAGVTLPGMPLVIAGHNEHVAWGFTALYADVQDLYVEKLDGKGNYQDLDGGWKALTVDHERIRVRGGRDVKLDVQLTGHGPLLNPIFKKETRAVALKWTLYDPSLNSLPLYEMNTAANWDEFSRAMATWCWPTQNVVYADDEGHIAYHAVGRVPNRPEGLRNVPISHGHHEWQGYIPFDQIPNAVDPPSGFLATANSRVSSDQFPARLTNEWVDPYRVGRIYKSLQGRDGLRPADMLAVQTDIYSEVDQELGHRFAYAIDHTEHADEQLKKAADLMRSWDGRLTTDSAAASLVTETRRALWPLILEPKLGDDAKEYQWAESNFAEEEIVMHSNPNWLPGGYKDWDALLTEAVRRGMSSGKSPSDAAAWAYGNWHVVEIDHPLAALLPLIGRAANTGPEPLSGDTTTVKQVGRSFGPSQRFIMDWSNVDGSSENIALGESGNLLSTYYRDQWKDYYGGTTFALPFSHDAVNAQTRHTLRLTP